MPERLYPFEWALCGLWMAVWSSIAWIAFTQESITLGPGKTGGGLRTFEDAGAIAVGFIALAAAAAGVWWLLRASRFRKLWRSVLVACWLSAVALYAVMGK
jgi:selenophosphate synthetase-related protein